MLDAYIIDRIRRERERAQQIDRRLPLEIEAPRSEAPRGHEVERQKEPAYDRSDDRPVEDRPVERGSVVVDYTF